MPTGNISWRIFTYKELYNATNGFSEDNKLGEGGFGSVYWGKTSDGLQVGLLFFFFFGLTSWMVIGFLQHYAFLAFTAKSGLVCIYLKKKGVWFVI